MQNIDEMLNPETEAPLGNHDGFLHVRLPIMGKVKNPMEIVRRPKRTIDRHKFSLGVFLNVGILRCLGWLKGLQVCLSFNISITQNSLLSRVVLNGGIKYSWPYGEDSYGWESNKKLFFLCIRCTSSE